MKVYTSDGQFAANVAIADSAVSVTGPFSEEIQEIIGEDRIIFVAPVEAEGLVGDIAETLPAGSVENAQEFLDYPKRWGYRV